MIRLTRTLPQGKRKILMAAGLTLALAWVVFIAYQYQTTKKPFAELPGVPRAGLLPAVAPSYLQAFYGPSETALAAPLAVAASPKGDRFYVTEGEGEHTTLVFDRTGNLVGKLFPPNTEAGTRLPLYAAVDPGGTVFISDRFRATIDMYSSEGGYLGTYIPSANPPLAPIGLAFDQAGNFYVTDVPVEQHRLLIYGADRSPRLTIGKEGSAPGEFSFPNGVAVDRSGHIYVADSNNGRVQVFDRDGKLLDVIGRGGRGTLGLPRGVNVDASGRLFIVDATAQVVEVWDVSAEPRRLYTVGAEGAGDGEFSYPNGVALDATGRVYVTDRVNNRVVAWSY